MRAEALVRLPPPSPSATIEERIAAVVAHLEALKALIAPVRRFLNDAVRRGNHDLAHFLDRGEELPVGNLAAMFAGGIGSSEADLDHVQVVTS